LRQRLAAAEARAAAADDRWQTLEREADAAKEAALAEKQVLERELNQVRCRQDECERELAQLKLSTSPVLSKSPDVEEMVGRLSAENAGLRKQLEQTKGQLAENPIAIEAHTPLMSYSEVDGSAATPMSSWPASPPLTPPRQRFARLSAPPTAGKLDTANLGLGLSASSSVVSGASGCSDSHQQATKCNGGIRVRRPTVHPVCMNPIRDGRPLLPIAKLAAQPSPGSRTAAALVHVQTVAPSHG